MWQPKEPKPAPARKPEAKPGPKDGAAAKKPQKKPAAPAPVPEDDDENVGKTELRFAPRHLTTPAPSIDYESGTIANKPEAR